MLQNIIINYFSYFNYNSEILYSYDYNGNEATNAISFFNLSFLFLNIIVCQTK